MKSKSLLVCLALALLATLFLPCRAVHAQFPGMDALNPMGLMRDAQSGPLNLLSLPDVQKELKTDKAQNEAVKKLMKERETLTKSMSKGGGGSDPSAMRTMMQKMQSDMAALDTRARALLTDPQRTRLGEIRVQVLGTQAGTDPETQTALALTAEQKTTLSTLANEAMQARMMAMRDYRNMKRKTEAINKEFGEKAAKILTAEQTARLAAMAGAPFKNAERIRVF